MWIVHLLNRLDVIEFERVGRSPPLGADRFASRIREISRGGAHCRQPKGGLKPDPSAVNLHLPKAAGLRMDFPSSQRGIFRASLAESLPRDSRDASSELETWPLATHRAFNLVPRGLFGLFVRVFARVFGAPGGTCTNRPNRGGTAAALTIGPAATSLFRRASACRFRPFDQRVQQTRCPVGGETRDLV